MDKMLVLDPDKRVSASMALELPMFADFREPEEETEALPYDHSMDNADLPLEQWKRKSREGGRGKNMENSDVSKNHVKQISQTRSQ